MTDVAVTYAEDVMKRSAQKKILDAEVQAATVTLSELTRQVREASSTIESHSSEIKRLEELKTSLSKSIEERQGALTVAIQESTSALEHLKDLRAEIASAETRIEHIKKIQEQLPTIEERYIELTSSVAIAESQNASLVSENLQVKREIVASRETLVGVQAQAEKIATDARQMVKDAQEKSELITKNIDANIAEAKKRYEFFEMEGRVPARLVRLLQAKLNERNIKFDVLKALEDY